jgi:hypothetical protein
MPPESSTQASGAPLLTCTDVANRAFRFRCWSSPVAYRHPETPGGGQTHVAQRHGGPLRMRPTVPHHPRRSQSRTHHLRRVRVPVRGHRPRRGVLISKHQSCDRSDEGVVLVSNGVAGSCSSDCSSSPKLRLGARLLRWGGPLLAAPPLGLPGGGSGVQGRGLPCAERLAVWQGLSAPGGDDHLIGTFPTYL